MYCCMACAGPAPDPYVPVCHGHAPRCGYEHFSVVSGWEGISGSSPPQVFDRVNTKGYWLYGKAVSGGCDGPVIVRAVFKVLATQQIGDTQCPWSGLAGHAYGPAVTRCELQLPDGGGSEAERAVQSSETNCYKCRPCKVSAGEVVEGGCPHKAGTWYVDSYMSNVRGCKSTEGPDLNRYFMNVYVGDSIQVAKLQVCAPEMPFCFDRDHEAKKEAAALECTAGKC